MKQVFDRSFSSMGGNDEVHFLSFSCNRPRMQSLEQQKEKINVMVSVHTKIDSVARNKEGKIVGNMYS